MARNSQRLYLWYLVAAFFLLMAAGLLAKSASASMPTSNGLSDFPMSQSGMPPIVDSSYYYRLQAAARASGRSAPQSTPTPALIGQGVSPRNALPGQTVVLTYTINSPSSQAVSLGAGMRPSLCLDYFYEPSLDITVTIPSGVSTVSRTFVLPNTSNIAYDVTWGIWSPGFGVEYSFKNLPAQVRVSGPTATPEVPSLQSDALGPSPAPAGSSIVLTYTIYSPDARPAGLGADMAPDGSNQFIADPANDRVVNLVSGTNVFTRSFNLASRPPGVYTVRWGVWDPAFVNSVRPRTSAERSRHMAIVKPFPYPLQHGNQNSYTRALRYADARNPFPDFLAYLVAYIYPHRRRNQHRHEHSCANQYAHADTCSYKYFYAYAHYCCNKHSECYLNRRGR